MHKNKTLATLLASALGGTGAHRFYLYGRKDRWAWLYLGVGLVYTAWLAKAAMQSEVAYSTGVWFPLSIIAGFIEALVIGLTPDDAWDARHNSTSIAKSRTGWPHVALLVLTLMGGYIVFVACLARATDLIYTGGSFG